ncbi:MAG: FG-GAP repeat protein [Phycisphaerales bacterium]|nr:FG-GAP repeat protein [Phycisphaerales bacterium]
MNWCWRQSEGNAAACRHGTVYLFAGGEQAEDKFGQSPASGGDINGDGTTDIVIASSLFAGETNTNVVASACS